MFTQEQESSLLHFQGPRKVAEKVAVGEAKKMTEKNNIANMASSGVGGRTTV
jgi:hypothetical protein